ncbi:ROK family transcriptional regulator [Nakamurella antarctica]|uniref:ROK family transcriptional regulator n=1 Tax=Nakamurella antarctica TaxID=1902245 RepID=A0A3G8ZQJ0_9ACTN|nr:ROK family transcriptional regulator [Nakamurella antarctica]AZI56824.1 ROK family transcriptional regulator [Nakamurella antarctica]
MRTLPNPLAEIPWPALSESSRLVLIDLLVHGSSSRADLARQSGVSPASLTRITRSMVSRGLLKDSEAAPSNGLGRPASPVELNVDKGHLVGINLTATELRVARTDLRATVLFEQVIPIGANDPASVADLIAQVTTEQIAVDPSVFAVGVSLAGPVPPHSEVITASPFLGWSQVPLVDLVRRRTGITIVVENDVRALTAAEHWFGAAAGLRNFVLITIGAGVGCGMVVDNRLLDGTGFVGQVGHLPITDSGPFCERGHRGCVRAYLSSGSITRQVASAPGNTDVSYEDVIELAAAGDPVAGQVVNAAGMALGVLIGTVATIVGPEKVLVSGEGITVVPGVLPLVLEHARRTQHWATELAPVEVSPFDGTEWARGAAVVALRRQIERVET